jgi:hypothetical protein
MQIHSVGINLSKTDVHLPAMWNEPAICLIELAIPERAVVVLQAGRDRLPNAQSRWRRSNNGFGCHEVEIQGQLHIFA